jgi:MoaA/NifB/PqqE/SkfB family radical SAM enzyme
MKVYQKPPILHGWRLSEDDREEYLKEKKLGMIYAGTSSICDLGCIYCQTKSGKPLPGETNITERLDILDQAKALGCKLVHIAGAGEPTIDPLFWKQVKHIHNLGMIPVIFTHGMHIDEKAAQKLWDYNASVIIKIHSREEELQDFFASRKGYTKRRDKGLQILIDAGFNKCNPTRLGIDFLITRKNLDEVDSVFIWARENNIFTEIKPILSLNRGANDYVKKYLDVTPAQVKEVFYRLLEIDQERFGYTWKPCPPWVGFHCDYYYYHILVSCQGDVKPCIGFDTALGNIRTHTLKECFEHPFIEKRRNIRQHLKGECEECSEQWCYGCPCRRIARKGEGALFRVDDCFEDNM